MSDSNLAKIKQINNGLANYYKLYSKIDYFNEEDGKFIVWCNANGFDDDGVIEELKQDDECMLLDFDEDFPFPGGKEPNNRNKFILKVILKCYKNKDAYNKKYAVPALKVPSKNDFEMDEKEMEPKKIEFKKHCPTIFDKLTLDDNTFVQLLCIGHKMNKPYLQLIADLYIRDKITHCLEANRIRDTYKNEIEKNVPTVDHKSVTATKLTAETWANMNKYTKAIENLSNNKTEFNLLTGALKSYFKRLCPEIIPCPTFEIQDNYPQICKYISDAVDFVYNLATKSCPFQFDLCIAFKEVKLKAYKVPISNDEDDDDDDVNEIETDNDEQKYIDCFGDIKGRLDKEGLDWAVKDIGVNDKTRFRKTFEELRNKIKIKQYPQRFRIVSILDRRSETDELIFCKARKDCFEFPTNKKCDNLWCFNSSKTCIIPAWDEKDPNDIINVNNGMNNGMLVLSFHVESVDQIRCYLYSGGQMMRFMADDLDKNGKKKSFLQQFFCESNNDEIDVDLIENIRTKLVDSSFDAFYKQNKIGMDVIEKDIKRALKKSIEKHTR